MDSEATATSAQLQQPTAKNLVAEVLKDPSLHDRLRARRTRLGIGLEQCIQAAVAVPEGEACLFAGDEDCFETFRELFDVVIARLHGLLPAGEVVCSSRPSNRGSGGEAPRLRHRLDPTGQIIQSVEVRAFRNVSGFPFPAASTRESRAELEMQMAKAFRGLAPAFTGVYLPLRQSSSYAPRLGGMDEFEEARLKAAGLHFGLPSDRSRLASGAFGDWPHGRGVFASTSRDLAIWTNHEEHLTVLSVVAGDGLSKAYRTLRLALEGLSEILRRRRPGEEAFAYSERLGFLTSDLLRLGGTLQANLVLKLPRLAATEVSHPKSAAGSWRSWAGLRRVKVEEVSGLGGTFRISNLDTFGATDAEVLASLEEVAFRLVVAEQQITTLTVDSDQLFPILTSVLSAAEGRESRTSLLSVFSGVVTQADSDELTQEMLAAMMREADTSNPTPKSPGATLLDTPEEDLLSLKDRVRLAMYSKLEDGSLEQAVQVAADAGGAQHFSDVPPPPPPEDLCEEDQELKEPEVEPVPAEETRRPTPQDLAALRRRTAELLAQAADSGGLGEILAEVKREMFLEVRQRVAGLLTEAADNGDLEKILEDVKGPPLPQEFAEKETSLRQKAARLLTEAADTGLLERVLQKGLEGHIQAEADRFELERREDRQVCHEAPDQDLAEVRAAAKAALLEAAETGALERAVADLKVKKPLEKSKEDTKSKAAALLCEAAESGRLQQALSEVRQTFTVSQKEALLAVRQRAAGLLSEAAVDGKLERILTEIGKEEIQTSRRVEVDVRSKVRTQLQEAALDGRLEAALANASEDRALDSLRPQEPQEPQEAAPHAAPAEAARQRIRARLLEGLEDGRLEQAVAKEAKHASAAKVTSAVTKVTMEEFSAKMFLEAFAEKGQRLQSLLRSIAEAEVQIRLREQRCQQLQARVSENKLELAHLDLDSEWCAKLLESAEERRKALQQSQRRLLGTLHGKMHELASAS